jgi:hypothetical protein
MSGVTPTWSIFNGFAVGELRAVPPPTWDAVDAMLRPALEAAEFADATLKGELAQWNRELATIGGDPAFVDWRRFRPLRLSREEDWSDWLAHLIETSRSGFLRAELGHDTAVSAGIVEREVSTTKGFRADLVVTWDDGARSHIEVKVGDLAFDKTFDTALALRHHCPDASQWTDCNSSRWTDHILLPEAHLSLWRETAKRSMHRVEVSPITWTTVAVALRRALRSTEENVSWKVWAATFTGAIEQILLGLPQRALDPSATPSFAQRMFARQHMDLLTR